MDAFLNPRNGASLTNIIDVTAHSISLFQEIEQLKNINELIIPQTSISIAEPIDAQIDELGNKIVQMYQFICIVSGEKVLGLDSIWKYMHESFFSKGDPAINEHHYHITKSNIAKQHITYTV